MIRKIKGGYVPREIEGEYMRSEKAASEAEGKNWEDILEEVVAIPLATIALVPKPEKISVGSWLERCF